MEKISWTDGVRNEEVLHIVKTDRNIKHTIKRHENWTEQVVEGEMEERVKVARRRG
jgi:hypothetical protein